MQLCATMFIVVLYGQNIQLSRNVPYYRSRLGVDQFMGNHTCNSIDRFRHYLCRKVFLMGRLKPVFFPMSATPFRLWLPTLIKRLKTDLKCTQMFYLRKNCCLC